MFVKARIKWMFISTFLTSFVVLFSGCWNGRVLIAMEQPYWHAKGGNAALRWPLVRASLAHGYLPSFLIFGAQTDPATGLARALKARHYRAVVVGPLLSVDQGVLLPQSTRFLLVGGSNAIQGNNAIRLVFNRTASFRTAGYAAGLSISAEAGGTVTTTLASRIGVLVSAHPSGTSEELVAFFAGVAQALEGGQPSVRTLSEPVDRNAVKAAIDQMRRDGVEIFLLLSGAPDSWALEDLKSSDGCAVVSNWALSRAFAQQVFLSIETDLVGGVAGFLSGQVSAAGIVNGPVFLIAGAARSIPAAVASQIVP